MDLDPLLLSRIQFAFVVSWHIIFPAFTIGLASFIAVLEALYFRTNNPTYLRLSQFWIKIFAVSFGMGVVSGIVMSFQFGTNWSEFAYASANFMGPVLSYEVVTAFFLEATFLGVLLFGRSKVPQGAHLFAACMVALGTFISSFWILAANSWMQTPAGVEMVDGVFRVTSWVEAIFNPSFPYRFAHMVLAAFLTTGFFVVGVAAWYLLKGRALESARVMFSMTFWLLAVLAPAQVIMGDLHGINTLENQPQKVAAMEGNWETRGNVPLLLFAIPDAEAETNHFEVGIPSMASVILTHHADGVVPGLKDWAPEDRPVVGVVFWSFRVMVGIGFLMVAAAVTSLVLRWRGRLFQAHWFHRACVAMMPLSFIAVLAGWLTTETGRYPWVVHGLMRVEEGVTPALTGGAALASLLVYIAVYAVVFAAGAYYILKIVQAGPDHEETRSSDVHEEYRRRPARPMSAADAALDSPE